MKRRDFIKANAAMGLAALAGGLVAPGQSDAKGVVPANKTFSLNYAPHFGMFENHAGKDEINQLRFMHEAGFRAFEDNEMSERPIEMQVKISRELERLDMKMGIFVANFATAFNTDLPSGDLAKREVFLKEIRASIDVAKRVNATWMTVVAGKTITTVDENLQNANIIESFKRAAAILEPHGLVMVLEPLSWVDGGYFVNTVEHCYLVCRAVGSPSLKLLYDVYHQQQSKGDLIANFDRTWQEVAYVQVGDVPGRAEPTTGEINYTNVFKHLRDKGYKGIIGMEHELSQPGKAGEQAVIDAYRTVDKA